MTFDEVKVPRTRRGGGKLPFFLGGTSRLDMIGLPAETGLERINLLVEEARAAQADWATLSVRKRVEILAGLPNALRAHADFVADAITTDMAKPRRAARREVAFAADNVAGLCKWAENWLAIDAVENGFVSYEPLGVVAVVSPWNFPLLTPVSAVVTALLAGNAVVFKPSEYGMRTAHTIETAFSKVTALPKGAMRVVYGGADHGRRLVESNIDMISFTGSRDVGKDIVRRIANRLPVLLLELGGVDPAIVLPDADISLAARKIVKCNVANSGQVCSAVRRVYAHQDVHDRFLAEAKARAGEFTIGDSRSGCDLGPLATRAQFDHATAIVSEAVAGGARVVLGGQPPPSDSLLFPPTIVTEVNHRMRIVKEEVLAPVLAVMSVDSVDQAVHLANDTRYGLSASVWTSNEQIGRDVAHRLAAGVVGINVHGVAPLGAPWGGVRESGIGRINTREGFRLHTNTKLIRWK